MSGILLPCWIWCLLSCILLCKFQRTDYVCRVCHTWECFYIVLLFSDTKQTQFIENKGQTDIALI